MKIFGRFIAIQRRDDGVLRITLPGVHIALSRAPFKVKRHREYREVDIARHKQLKNDAWTAAGGKCQQCGRPLVYGVAQIHHIVPVSLDKSLVYARRNIMLLCPDCHQAKHRNPVHLASEIFARYPRLNVTTLPVYEKTNRK